MEYNLLIMNFKEKMDKFLSNYEFGNVDSIDFCGLGRIFMNAGSSFDILIDGLTKIIGDKPKKIDYDSLEGFLYRFHEFISEKMDFDIKNNNYKINPSKEDIELYDTIILTNKNSQLFSFCWSITNENVYLLNFFRESFNKNTKDFGCIRNYIHIPSLIPFW